MFSGYALEQITKYPSRAQRAQLQMGGSVGTAPAGRGGWWIHGSTPTEPATGFRIPLYNPIPAPILTPAALSPSHRPINESRIDPPSIPTLYLKLKVQNDIS